MSEDSRLARRAELQAELHQLGRQLRAPGLTAGERYRIVGEMEPLYRAMFAIDGEIDPDELLTG